MTTEPHPYLILKNINGITFICKSQIIFANLVTFVCEWCAIYSLILTLNSHRDNQRQLHRQLIRQTEKDGDTQLHCMFKQL